MYSPKCVTELFTMLVLEVQLPQQEAMKKIEWNKEAPRFHELRTRVREFGVPHDWCVEVMRGNHFISPDDNAEIAGERITMRAAPIAGTHSVPQTRSYCNFMPI